MSPGGPPARKQAPRYHGATSPHDPAFSSRCLAPTAGRRAAVARTLGLDRRGRDRAVGGENTAISPPPPPPHPPPRAGVEKTASLPPRPFPFFRSATPASDEGCKDH